MFHRFKELRFRSGDPTLVHTLLDKGKRHTQSKKFAAFLHKFYIFQLDLLRYGGHATLMALKNDSCSACTCFHMDASSSDNWMMLEGNSSSEIETFFKTKLKARHHNL